MPQHLWHEINVASGRIRVCEVCDARQITGAPPLDWPEISPICPGDDDAPQARGRRPNAPTGGASPVAVVRTLEPA
jgi:hypothetical protein